MFNLIPLIIIILCLGGILVILLRKLPLTENAGENKETNSKEELTLEQKIEKFRKKRKVFLAKIHSAKKIWLSFRTLFLGLKTKTGRMGRRISNKASQIKTAIERKKFEREEEKYIKMVAKNPKDTEAYKNLGGLYIKMNNLKDAQACFKQVLKINPNDEEAKNKLAELKKMPG